MQLRIDTAAGVVPVDVSAHGPGSFRRAGDLGLSPMMEVPEPGRFSMPFCSTFFNASVFTVELVGIGMLREFGAVLTAILLAGRTDSAFTAQIGAMKMRQEIDAMRVKIGRAHV